MLSNKCSIGRARVCIDYYVNLAEMSIGVSQIRNSQKILKARVGMCANDCFCVNYAEKAFQRHVKVSR